MHSAPSSALSRWRCAEAWATWQAPQPVLRDDRVDHLALERGLVVALEAGLGAAGPEHVGGVRPVGVVAGDALAVLQHRVDVRLVHADRLLLVAPVAEGVAALLQEELRDEAVPEVAVLALPVLHRLVRVLQGGELVGRRLVAVEALLLLELLLRLRRDRRGEQEGRAHGQGEGQDGGRNRAGRAHRFAPLHLGQPEIRLMITSTFCTWRSFAAYSRSAAATFSPSTSRASSVRTSA